jgi:hypothetical protein
MQHPLIGVIDSPGEDEDAIVAEAYAHVAEGYRRALTVEGLPPRELDDLRACYRAAGQIARQPSLYALR